MVRESVEDWDAEKKEGEMAMAWWIGEDVKRVSEVGLGLPNGFGVPLLDTLKRREMFNKRLKGLFRK